MKIKHILLATILFSLGNLSFANNLLDGYVHTPNASEFGRYGEVPVSLYNGTANISVSLFETEQQGVPFQIALSYDNRGAHVIDLPTWVGQEWSLSCGGVINRVVKDIADEYVEPKHLAQTHGYVIKNYFSSCGKLQSLLDKNADKKTIKKERQEKNCRYDFSPDVFMFNFCGKSGRFLLGQDGQWKVYSDENLDIIFDVNDQSNYINPFIEMFPIGGACVEPKVIKGFTIIDQNGIRYHFGMNPDAIEYSTSRLGVYNSNDQIPWNANSWYLTKIEDRNANILYEFEYERGPLMTQAYKTQTISSGPFEANISSPVYLKRIKLFDGR